MELKLPASRSGCFTIGGRTQHLLETLVLSGIGPDALEKSSTPAAKRYLIPRSAKP